MEESKVADYFVVTGLPDNPEPMDDYSDQSHLKQNSSLAPITDITVIFPGNDEFCPDGWQCLDETPTGLTANLNYGSMNSSEVYICYKRGRDKPPLVDIGVLYENKDRILSDSEIVLKTPTGKSANVNSTTRTFLTYRRAREDVHANELVVTDICVIIASKGEKAPHAFCVIRKNLNKGIFGAEVYLCYKKSMNRAHVISYKPGILCRYPLWDRPDWKLHSNVPLFCLPMGASLEVWPPEASQPPTVFSTFILTVSDAAEKVYGSAVTFYERYPIEKLTQEQLLILTKSLQNEKTGKINLSNEDDSSSNNMSSEIDGSSLLAPHCNGIPSSYTVNVNKCICLLSHWPFFDTFETVLNFLYKLSTSEPHSVPIERYISHFLENVPFPSPQRPRILVQLSAEERVILFQPEDLPLPRSGAGFRELLLNLGAEDSLLVLLLVLTEHKILVHSLRPSILTAVVEAISMIIFPFKWQCPYIPLCPLGLAEVLHAPLPFLIGVDSRFFDLYDPPSDVTCVDLDTNNITVSEERRSLSYKLLPKRAARNLKNTLEDLFKKCHEENYYMCRMKIDEDADGMMLFHLKEREQKLQLEIQEAFLRFMATILKGYRSYLLPITRAPTVGTTDPSSLFDLQGFLKSRDRAHHKFFMMIMKTQMFIRFIEERSFVSDMDAGLAFFDECTEKVDCEDSYYRLLDYEESHKSERTVFIPPPEPTGLPAGATYVYEAYRLKHTVLRKVFFPPPRPDTGIGSGFHTTRHFLGTYLQCTGGLPSFSLDSNLFRNRETKNSLNVASHENMPGSPMARRTKHEVKSAQKLARRKHSQSAQSWAKCLLTTCYSLWFIHLPSFVLYDPTKSSTCLKIAYDLLVKIQKLKLHPTDEVCYRVMMQLFGIHSQPVLAVNLLSQMKMCGIQPNALTYGYYNRAVLEATWPSDSSNPSHLWNKLRNVIVGAALFRRGGHRASRNKLPEAESCLSLTSLDKTDLMSEFEVFDRKRSRLGSIVKPHPKNFQELAAHQPIESVAGILMTGLKKSSPVAGRRNSFSELSPKLQSTSSVASEANTSRLRRGSMSPTLSENKMLKILMRSDSFASDTSIVEKHNRSNKLNEKSKADLGISDTLSVPRESSESLDITDDFSLDDSWNSGRNSTQNHYNDTPTKNLLSKLSRLGSDVWSKSQWKTSQESVDSVPAASSEKSPKKSVLQKTDIPSDNKLSWKSSEDFSVSNSFASPTEIEDEKIQENFELDDGSHTVKNDSGPLKEDSSSVNKTVPCTKYKASEELLQSGLTLNQTEISHGEKKEQIEKQITPDIKLINGEDFPTEGNETFSPPKISPVRVPVTENDPLGALQSEIIFNCNEGVGMNDQDRDHDQKGASNSTENFKMKYDLDSYALFSNHQDSMEEIEGIEHMNKINSKKKEGGHGDASTIGGTRVPKSATFHHGREKDSKGNKPSKGCVAVEEEIISSRKVIQRSTTMPDAAAVASVSSSPSVASSLSNFGSNLKISFSRYSPSRFSLKKSDLRIAKTHILENAISGSKKSNELLLSGYNTFKSAATSIAKKIEEAISTNTTPVKSSNLSHEYEDEETDMNMEKSSAIDFESWGTNLKEFFGDGSRKGSSVNLQTQNNEEQSISEEVIFENLYGKNATCRQIEGPVALSIVMTTCCKCNNCNSVLHDEEIIAGWTPDDSNLNTKCHFCGKSTLPFLSVSVYDYRRSLKSKPSTEAPNIFHPFLNWQQNSSNLSVNNVIETREENRNYSENILNISDGVEKNEVDGGNESESVHCDATSESTENNVLLENVNNEDSDGEVGCTEADNDFNIEPHLLEPINVPYLNPLVLRKELENILQHEGDPSLTKPSFVDQHPIIYWNMVWVFERINVTSHLPGLALKSSAVNKEQLMHPSWKSKCDESNISIRCLWDNPRLHEETGPPMYVLWQQQDPQSVLVNALVTERITFSKSVMQNVIANLRCDNLCDPMRQLINERKKLRKRGFSHSHSLYRDILFLAIVAFERQHINLDHFDREYRKVYDKLKAEGFHLLKCDKPPVSASYRNYFRPLLL